MGKRFLIVGSGNYDIYEVALYKAFNELGYDTILFTFNQYFKLKDKQPVRNFVKKFEANTTCGLFYNNILNKELLSFCRQEKFDYIFFYNCRLFFPRTISKIKELGTKVIAYSNDNPFSNDYPHYFWKKYINLAKKADIVYAYRKSNIEDYQKIGCEFVRLLRSYYIDGKNYPVLDNKKSYKVPDVLFLGHVEDDFRKECINKLITAGISLGLQSGTRQFFVPGSNAVELSNSHKDYNFLLSQCKIALVFLSTKNKDTYTRRCFEIPAAGTCMISVYTDDLASMFAENKEIVFFRSSDELLKKVNYFLHNEKEREQIALQGMNRLIRDGHEVKDRVKQIVNDCNSLK